eukprot:CAMPEP_0202890228 /NCGR_PEP_ID=MMETSP1392-20130828/719_1 /ASSEMBLY_ACC=CAM_ASM_000868 /TAXON_ID=225041 /ORGANISM="Chlamydomonas chlamydogama, Strain SAG 11-48b" /LENGTH=78 /DNA_ID=CAMNT_0049573765 /DNA_START=1631 /DNA_END=1867 /DNA_ORIENTATION=+
MACNICIAGAAHPPTCTRTAAPHKAVMWGHIETAAATARAHKHKHRNASSPQKCMHHMLHMGMQPPPHYHETTSSTLS